MREYLQNLLISNDINNINKLYIFSNSNNANGNTDRFS